MIHKTRQSQRASSHTLTSYLSAPKYKASSCKEFLCLPVYVTADFCIRFDYAQEYPTALAEMGKGLVDGRIQRRFHIVEGGVEEAPKALSMLFSGGNTGKLYVNVPAGLLHATKFVLQSREGG